MCLGKMLAFLKLIVNLKKQDFYEFGKSPFHLKNAIFN